ncbi:hypothetical protein GRF29_1g3255710 [Pseudopithomyces chartarum]|uniref:Rhamnogalacturonate lyase n=1 Tax=Pseudopithomyces chartarum TaxID=1892770 RepID=A0AAN6RLC2_9PLEO|nr:hypothetical protein GRF29_1g3255710 [Pseudopithomyces chartarum]
MFLQSALLATFAFSSSSLAAFGVTTSGNNIIVDAGSDNAFKISVNKNSCDINSISYRGEEFQYQSTGSHISSGLGSATVSSTIINNQYAKITCKTSTLTHYIVVRSGDSTIFMATDTTAEPSVGELRFIARLQPSKLPLEYPFGSVSTTSGSSSTVEGSDVFVVNGQTRSKFYSSERFIDDYVHCVYRDNDAIHACMLLNSYSYEASSGGPFFRDINSNNAGDSTNLYFYMNSGHVQTETYRMGLHGPQRQQPILDLPRLLRRLHLPPMKPGTYTQVLYQGEFKLSSLSVTVRASTSTSSSITGSLPSHTTLFQIGDYDGRPTSFRNADKFLRMHPSDSRMSSWGPLTYTVGSSSLSDVPMALFKSANAPFTIKRPVEAGVVLQSSNP